MDELVTAVDDPGREDIQALLLAHLAFVREHSPPEDVHALDPDGLQDLAVTFFSARRDGRLLAVGALKTLDEIQAELKSMHTAHAFRGQGAGRAMLGHLLAVARARGHRRVCLETGSMAAFTPAQSLYEAAGFAPSPPFATYAPSPNSTFLTLTLD